MTLYVYDVETMEVVARIRGEDNRACERIASDRYGDTDRYGWTYTPAFGARDGLIDTADAIDIDATVSEAAAALGRKGRAVNSPAQQATARANGAKGGRPKMRRVMVKGRYGDGMAVEIVLRDGKTATRGQYESALRRLGGHNPINSGLVLVNKSEGEIPVYDGDQPWAMLS